MKLCEEGFSMACYFPKFRFLSIKNKGRIQETDEKIFWPHNSEKLKLWSEWCQFGKSTTECSALAPFLNLTNLFQVQIFKSPFFKELRLSYRYYQARSF